MPPHSLSSEQTVIDDQALVDAEAAGASDVVPTLRLKEHEELVLPENNLPLVFAGLMLALFLAALDQTIVATALPTIVGELGGGNEYSWVGSAYLLASAALNTVIGKFSDIFGRKAVLYPAIVFFLIGSALCGAAQSMVWLIIARAVQGIGGGGIIQMTNIIAGDLVSLEQRGKFQGLFGGTWGIASIIGPLIGGILTDRVSWRWCFWVNLPTGGVAFGVLFFFLNLNPHHGKTFREHISEFDFLGLFLLLSGVICFLLGFTQSETSWSSPATISLLSVGTALLVSFGVWECYTYKSPIVPPRIFKTRTTGILLVSGFLQCLIFFTSVYYLPLYFQVLGASATRAGILMMPFSLTLSVLAAVAGYLIKPCGGYRPIIWTSFAVTAIGYGLMTMLDDRSTLAQKVIFPLVTGFGIGSLFTVPLVAMQAAMSVKDMATSVAGFMLVRNLGTTLGVSIGQAIWSSELRRRIGRIADLPLSLSGNALVNNVRQLQDITPPELRQQILHAYTKAIGTLWIVASPVAAVCFIMTLFLKNYTLKRVIIRGNKPTSDEIQEAPSEKDLDSKVTVVVETIEVRDHEK